MVGLGIPELVVIVAVIALLLGYKKLPETARAIGRSTRILRAELRGLHHDDVATKAPAQRGRGPLGSGDSSASADRPD
ncbi:MAG: twin-arginine translocase TatA/TatE family subunit [Mycobacteriales bacterium]|nr:MAG: twin-arginine translocase TatA/TatE family subunit [Pseudonocardiales bacterium]